MSDQTALVQYREQLIIWEEQEEERKHLFTITEQDIIQQRKANISSHCDLNRYQVITMGCLMVAMVTVTGITSNWSYISGS